MPGHKSLALILMGISATLGWGAPEARSDVQISDQLGGQGTRPLTTGDAFSFQMANSPREHQRPFSFGNRLFNTNWVEAPASVKSFDGLGPLFNRVSCSGCHTKDGRGQPPASGNGPMDQMLLRLSVPGIGKDGGVKPHPIYGDQLNERAIRYVPPEGAAHITYTEMPGRFADGEGFSLRAPHYTINQLGYGPLGDDILISPRVAPAMIGLGLLQAIPQDDIATLADPQDQNGDGISGRVNMVWDNSLQTGVPGRFGWKASQPNLRQQNAAAAIGDIGLTTSLAMAENCTGTETLCAQAMSGGAPEINDEFLEKLTLYTMTLAVPAQRNADAENITAGARHFAEMGCMSCHVPSFTTSKVEGFPELSDQKIHPFTDLLLHDMGPALSDDRPDFDAQGSEWRTPPLWGLGLYPVVGKHNFLLHDGRARNISEAILWHDGEARHSRNMFRQAPRKIRDELLAFLSSI